MTKITRKLLKKIPEKFHKRFLISLIFLCLIICISIPLLISLMASGILIWIPANIFFTYILFTLSGCFVHEILKLNSDVLPYLARMDKPNMMFNCNKIDLLPKSLQYRTCCLLLAISVTACAVIPGLILKIFVSLIMTSAIAIPIESLMMATSIAFFVPIENFYYWNTIFIPEIEDMRN